MDRICSFEVWTSGKQNPIGSLFFVLSYIKLPDQFLFWAGLKLQYLYATDIDLEFSSSPDMLTHTRLLSRNVSSLKQQILQKLEHKPSQTIQQLLSPGMDLREVKKCLLELESERIIERFTLDEYPNYTKNAKQVGIKGPGGMDLGLVHQLLQQSLQKDRASADAGSILSKVTWRIREK